MPGRSTHLHFGAVGFSCQNAKQEGHSRTLCTLTFTFMSIWILPARLFHASSCTYAGINLHSNVLSYALVRKGCAHAYSGHRWQGRHALPVKESSKIDLEAMIEIHRIHFARKNHALFKFVETFLHAITQMPHESFCKTDCAISDVLSLNSDKKPSAVCSTHSSKYSQEGLSSPQMLLTLPRPSWMADA